MSEILERLGCGCAAVTAQLEGMTRPELLYLIARIAARLARREDIAYHVLAAKQCHQWALADAAFTRSQEAGARHQWTESARHYKAYERHYKAADALWDRAPTDESHQPTRSPP